MNKSILLISVLSIWSLLLKSGLAQVTSDQTLLKENSVVELQNNRVLIKGGASRRSTLFHSLKELSIGTGQEVYFNNPSNINLILTRITGGNRSNINGTLGVLGDADLFLMNPSGIHFGPDSYLDLNGSFLATTGSSFIFNDGTSFSASNPQPLPNLKISVPIGIQFGDAAQGINIQSVDVVDPSVTLCNNPCFSQYPNLSVNSENTITILGGDVNFIQGGIQSINGNIEIGSVAPKSYVSLRSANKNWQLGYENVKAFKDINIQNSSKILIYSTDFSRNKYVKINARNLNIKDEASIDAFSYANGTGGDIFINTRDSLNISNNTTISSSSFLNSRGGNISINAKNTIANNKGKITSTSSFGESGSISIVSEEILLRDDSEIILNSNNALGGSLYINGSNLTLKDNSGILITAKNGQIGDIKFLVRNILLLDDKSKILFKSNGFSNNNFVSSIDFDTGFLVRLDESTIQFNTPSNVNITALGIFDTSFPSNTEIAVEASEKYQNSLAQPKDIVKRCRPGQSLGNSTFVNVGRGGVPLGPHHIQTPPSIWQDLRKPEISSPNSPSSKVQEKSTFSKRETSNQSSDSFSVPIIVEAQGWVRDKQGRVVLTANPSKLMAYNSGLPIANC